MARTRNQAQMDRKEGGCEMVKGVITQKEIAELRKRGLVVHVYPRKKQVCVSGWKYYKLVK